MNKRLGAISLAVVLLGAVGAIARSSWVEGRKSWLKESAEMVYLSQVSPSKSSGPGVATPNVWESLTEADKRNGKIQTYKVKSVHVPILGYPQTVVVETVRDGKKVGEMLVSIGSGFNDHQLLVDNE